ncbi:hypothetical protein AVEN_261816-1 [Araneus ventricosus]|uniref:Uncharacterized protein n=1 Tax=Araneus ventricosus TaxID=182803 RepID=A0A4Y2M1Z1_ARAVE|nr:hypothetical protein AVEN_261816-1 [Araneus ventricosus]
MSSSPEEIIKITYVGLERFLENTLNASDFQDFQTHRHKIFPTWDHLWENLHRWLRRVPLNTMPETILSLADQLPGAKSFRPHLQNSLVLHDEFWNQVYQNLLTAKSRLPC